MSLGVNFDDLNREYYYRRASNIPTASTTGSYSNSSTNPIELNSTVSDNSLFSQVGSGNTCTDGKDDGKIGLFSAIGNIAQGVVRTVPNMIKGMFTDSDGNFSLLKTATTVGTAALCIAFPAAGLVACGIGAATSGVKIVQGVSSALGATTDAEAKAAWENVGSGGLTLGLSVAGAKASFKTMESQLGTSASFAKEGSFIESLKQNPLNTVKNLGKDMTNSIKLSCKNIWQGFKDFTSNSKTKAEAKEYNKKLQDKNELSKKQKAKGLTEKEQKQLNKLKKEIKNTDKEVRAKAKEIRNDAKAKACAENAKAQAKTKYENLKNKNAKKIEAAEGKLDEAENFLKNTKEGTRAYKRAQSAVKNAKTNLENVKQPVLDAQKTYQDMTLTGKFKNAVSTYTKSTRSALKQGDTEGALATIRKNLSFENLGEIKTALGEDASEILAAIKRGDSFKSISTKFGWQEVMDVIEAFSGVEALDITV